MSFHVIVIQDTVVKMFQSYNVNKNAFQWDAHHPLVDRIPACTGQEGGCMPACTGWGCISACTGQGVCIPACTGQGLST